MIVDWTDEFDRWLSHAEEQGGPLLETAVALLGKLNDLSAKPGEESMTFKRVRQAHGTNSGESPIPITRTWQSG